MGGAQHKHTSGFTYIQSFPGIPSLGSNAYSCPCSSCKTVLKETAHWTSIEKGEFSSIFKIGDRVLVYGALPGVVRYVGDLDSDHTNAQVLVGVKLDDPGLLSCSYIHLV